jgi:hypothetical protein
MTATSWTAVASVARHRFCPGGTAPNQLADSCARKRRRRSALPAHSKTATAESEKAGLQNAVTATDQEIDKLVYDLYGLTEVEKNLVAGGQ